MSQHGLMGQGGSQASVQFEEGREFERNRQLRDRKDLADERAREFWERAALAFLYDDVQEAVKDADELIVEWRKRFAPEGK